MSQNSTGSHNVATAALNPSSTGTLLETGDRSSLNDEEISADNMDDKLRQRLLQGRNASDINKERRPTALLKLERSAYRFAVDFQDPNS